MTTPHTPPAALLDVAAIEARAAAIADDSRYITLTPWVLEDDGEGDYIIAAPESAIDAVARIPRVEGSSIDAAFIVRAVNEAAGLASDVLALIVENERLRALAAQHAADVAAASRSTRESCAATLRARAECLRRYAYEATAKADATEYTHDASEVDACAAIVASVAIAAPTTVPAALLDVAAIEARAAAATPDAVTYSYEGLTRGEDPRHQFSICNGTWEDEPTRPHRCIAMVYSDSEDSAPDAEFYANARRDVFMLLAHVRRLAAALADSDARVASAVAAERARCAAVCRDIASDATDDDPVSETADECAEAIERASAPTGGRE